MIEISTTATFDRLFTNLPAHIQRKAAKRTELHPRGDIAGLLKPRIIPFYNHGLASACIAALKDIKIYIMKTIAISIEEDILRSMDELAKKRPHHAGNRSRIIRAAIKEFVKKELQQESEAREREIFKRHRTRLERQARALISEQAKP